ncbi:hypothetical protein ACJX0J_027302, partial [Zea mays]
LLLIVYTIVLIVFMRSLLVLDFWVCYICFLFIESKIILEKLVIRQYYSSEGTSKKNPFNNKIPEGRKILIFGMKQINMFPPAHGQEMEIDIHHVIDKKNKEIISQQIEEIAIERISSGIEGIDIDFNGIYHITYHILPPFFFICYDFQLAVYSRSGGIGLTSSLFEKKTVAQYSFFS